MIFHAGNGTDWLKPLVGAPIMAAEHVGTTSEGLFFLNASSGQLPLPFVQALVALDYRPIPLAGAVGEKVVDIGIQRTLEAIAERRGDVVLASHDGDFMPQMSRLLSDERRVGLIGFREFVSTQLANLEGLNLFDIEDDADAFTVGLPRVRVIPLDRFDPTVFL